MSESPVPPRKKVELTPPPRIRANAPVAPEMSWNPSQAEASGAEGRTLRWMTVVGFLFLAGIAVAVFVVLPDWAKQRRNERPSVAQSVVPAPVAAEPVAAEPVASEPVASEPVAPERASERVAPERVAPEPVFPAPVTQPAASEPVIDQAFVQAMTEGLGALQREDFEAARNAFEQARQITPDSPQVADGLARADASWRRQIIADHRAEASLLEGEEKWRDALRHYEAVLDLDPSVSFAQQGRELAQGRAELLEGLQRHVSKPDRLATPAVLEEASLLVARASDIEDAGPRHRRFTSDLERLVEVFSTPIRARLRSDQQTEIVVYKVGRLGVFDERVLDLRPGSYTVVGSRRGYRDVRRQLIIEPGKAPEPLLVRCEEKI